MSRWQSRAARSVNPRKVLFILRLFSSEMIKVEPCGARVREQYAAGNIFVRAGTAGILNMMYELACCNV